MKVIIFAAAFLLICIGVAVIAAIPLLFAYARRQEEVAQNINVSTQIRVSQYNASIEASGPRQEAPRVIPPPPPQAPKKPLQLRPVRGGKDGPSKGNDDLRPKR